MKDYTTRYIAAALLIIALIGWGLTPVQAAETAPVVAATASTVTLESSLVSIIQSVQTGVQAGVTFLSEEIPDVLRQLIMWKAAYHSMWAVLQASLIVIAFVMVRKCLLMITEHSRLEQLAKEYDYIVERSWLSVDQEKLPLWIEQRKLVAEAKAASEAGIPSLVIYCVLTGIALIFGAAGAINVFGNLLTLTQLLIAPKVWLIEYAASLVK